MRAYRLDRLSDAELTEALHQVIRDENAATAAVLAHFAEFAERRLYVPAGYSCLRDYRIGRLRLSENAAYRRITAARATRDFPGVLEAISEGRLHLSALCVPQVSSDEGKRR